ncbi:hypothetical protein T03_16858 [Trichinella britovi]|uniref:Uncharacterized protein n=1 Tax=Trichinella britovi TaxID=45882 RepID=A0A0V1D1C9_TRIBR|nr:hypothetical protein T03_16858 [Trichinella britovi]KRZ90444.1 hypothetical protein T08_4757 [Trichinella sp. T8]
MKYNMQNVLRKQVHVLDLEQVVNVWARDVFRFTKNSEQKHLSEECLQYDINWSNVKMTCDEPQYSVIPKFRSDQEEMSRLSIQPRILFKSIFSNSTNRIQEHSFRAERVSTSVCSVCVENGIIRGADFEICMKTPNEILEANVGFKRELHFSRLDEDTIEEQLIWSVDSKICVPPHTETTAELVMSEAQCSASFKVGFKIQGRVVVVIRNMKANHSMVTMIEGNIADIVMHEISKGLNGFKVKNRIVFGEMIGKCNFKFGLEQRVTITETPLKENEK